MEDGSLSTSTTSEDDALRREMLWNSKIEALFLKWKGECEESAQEHAWMGTVKKICYYSLATPCILLPFCMGAINFESDSIYTTTNFVTSGITAFSTFVNFSQQYTEHYDCETRYRELAMEIDAILVKPRRDRIQADVQLETTKNRLEYLNKTSVNV
jgi:hypothetical protein